MLKREKKKFILNKLEKEAADKVKNWTPEDMAERFVYATGIFVDFKSQDEPGEVYVPSVLKILEANKYPEEINRYYCIYFFTVNGEWQVSIDGDCVTAEQVLEIIEKRMAGIA